VKCACKNNLQLSIVVFVFPSMSTCLQHGIVSNITWTLGELEVDYLILIFLLKEDNNKHWLQFFWMKEYILFYIVNQLKPLLKKHDTWYKLIILVEVWGACALYKKIFKTTTCGWSRNQWCMWGLICNELFVVIWLLVLLVLREIIIVINIVFKKVLI